MAEPSAEVKELKPEVRETVHDCYLFLQQSFASLTEAWLLEEASRQIAGTTPTGSPGGFLHDYLEAAGLLPNTA